MCSLHYLASRGDPIELLATLEAGADPDERGIDGKTPLMVAANRGAVVAARLLLKFRADVNAVDEKGRTALHDASALQMKRLLLDAGADPDLGRKGGMTLMAFFATFRDRGMVDLLLSYGADTDKRIRKGPTVQEALDDPEFGWNPPNPFDKPNRDRGFILKMSDDLRISPESFVAEHRNIILWGISSRGVQDPRLGEWVERVTELLNSPDELEAAYRGHLTGETLEEALRSVVRQRWRAEKDGRRKERVAEFERRYFANEPPQSNLGR